MTVENPVGPDRIPVELPLLRPLFDALGVGIWATDRSGAVTACSPQAEQLLGYPEQVLAGRVLHDLAHRDEAGEPLPAQACPILRVLRDGRAAEGTGATFRRADGSLITVNWGAAPMVLGGEVTGSVVAFFDVSREQVAREEVERELESARDSSERFKLMADIGTLLASGMELSQAMRELAGLVVSAIGDWSAIDLFTSPTQLWRVAVAHRDPGRLAGVPTQTVLPPPEPDGGALAEVWAGAEVIVIDEVARLGEPRSEFAAEQQRLFAQLGAGSAVVTSLRVGERVLGALTVARAQPAGFSEEDVALLQDVARRAALAVDSARAYALQRRAAETLQRSLLTEPPAVPGLQIAARYLPAVAETRLGGDWYDAFCLPGGALAVVIGDVAGHDVAAAAVMAQVRNLLRAHAIDGGEPSAVLTRLEATAEALAVPDLVTLVYGRLEPEPGGWRFTWSNAGHPPPLVIDGPARYLAAAEDPPIGIQPAPRRSESVLLAPGATLLLYTDGLVERRGQDLDEGLADLARFCVRLGPDPARLLTGLVTEFVTEPADDVAVLALRVEP